MEWTTTRCFRSLRPLKTKLSTLRTQITNRTSSKRTFTDNDEADSSLIHNEQSLILEDHILPYTKSKNSYKKRKLLQGILSKEDEEDDHEDYLDETFFEVSEVLEQKDQWTTQQKVIDHWKYLDDVFEGFKMIIVQNYDRASSNLKLSEKCALEIGINIGLNIDINTKLVMEQEVLEMDRQLLQWYDDFQILKSYKKYMMIGHAIGLLFSNLDILIDVIEYLIVWCKPYGLEKLLMELYIENIDPLTFWDKYESLKELSDALSTDFEDILIRHIHNKITGSFILNGHNLEMVENLIEIKHESHYSECLRIIYLIISQNCIKLQDSHRLVETLQTLSIEQIVIINQLSHFIEILKFDHKYNLTFIRNVYKSLKSGYRGLIPTLKTIKLFLKNIKPSRPISDPEQLAFLKSIFKQHYRHTPKFIMTFLAQPDIIILVTNMKKSPSTKKRHIRRSTNSSGDLI